MKRLLLCTLMLGVLGGLYAQNKATLSGYVRNAADGEVLLFANVFVQELQTGTTTNHYGFYSLTLPEGRYTLSISYLGYQSIEKTVNLTGDTELNIDLHEGGQVLQEVVVSGKAADEAVTEVAMSRIDLPIQQIKKLPALFGEPDVIKTIQVLPGVTNAGEGTSAYFVRGGSADQNLVLIDEAPVYDVSHLFGLFSVFNSDIIKSAELYKGGIPAKYGGRLSSLLEVTTKDGNDKKFEGAGGIGLMAARLSLEGPIQKEKASFIVSGRRSYADLIMKEIDDLDGTTVSFYDLNAKVNWRPNNKNRFFIAAYDGRDIWRFSDDFKMGWGNTTATFRWNHLFNEKLFSNTTLVYSDFDYRLEDLDVADGFVWDANQREMSLKEDLTYFVNPNLTLQMGYQGIYRRFSPGTITPNNEESIFKETKLQKLGALDHGLYLGAEHKINDRLSLQYGLRFSIFQNIGAGTVYDYEDRTDNVEVIVKDSTVYGSFENIKTFSNLEPRFNARYRLNSSSSLKFSYQRMAQYIHLLSNSTVPIPFNTWAPSSPHLDPQLADQLALGYFKNFRNNTYEFSVETFYKKAENVTEFADHANVFFNKHLATEFRQGDSESYGLELFIRKVKGPLQGFASYTLSKAIMDVPGINEDQEFVANHDRRHNLNLALTYALSDQWDVGTNFTFSSGRPITLPTGKFQFDNYQVDYYSGRNGYRLPDFHRLDLSVTYNSRKNKDRKFKRSMTAGIYNAYNQQNPYTIYTRKKQDDDGNIIGDGTEKEARLVYLFGIMPYFSWNFQF